MKRILAVITLIGLSSSIMAADLTPSCVEYFQQMDQLEAASPQSEEMKSVYEHVKQQLAAMSNAAQEQSCKQASKMIKQAVANMLYK